MSDIYEPREDSYLLEKEVKKYAHGTVLDVGTGSGIQAVAALSSPKTESVLAVDINPNVIKQRIKGIKLKKSNLFSNVKGKFDTIIFNPPYLPNDARVKDIALDGGKKGYELLERFLNELSSRMMPKGIALILFSSLTNKAKVGEIIANNLLEATQLSSESCGFEELFVYLLRKSVLLQELEAKGLKNVRFLAKGNRGVAYKAGNKVIKVERGDSGAMNRIKNEVFWLERLNRKGIGPKFRFSGEGYFVMDFIEGERIDNFMRHASRKRLAQVLKEVMRQCRIMDIMGVNKEEMTNPHKHILVSKKVVLIDFERAHYAVSPQNVTQFCNYVPLVLALDRHSFNLAAAEYKKDMSKKSFNNILRMIK